MTLDEKIERMAMNLVYQLDDDAGLSVEFRQANNDKRIDFVKKVISALPVLGITEERERINDELPVSFLYRDTSKDIVRRLPYEGERLFDLVSEGYEQCLLEAKSIINKSN